MSSDEENQSDEVSVLQSIFTDEELTITRDDNFYKGQFFASVDLSPDFKVEFSNLNDLNSSEKESILVSYLPPICLSFELPSDYPSKSPPKYKISCEWMTLFHLAKLCSMLDSIWDENECMAILFNWFSFLKDESLEYLGLANVLNVSGLHSRWLRNRHRHNTPPENPTSSRKRGNPERHEGTSSAVQNKRPERISQPDRIKVAAYREKIERTNVADIVSLLRAYSDDRARTVFQRTHFSCDICFENAMGRDCTQFLPCKHVFCNECVGGFFKARIESNQVTVMPCLADGCDSEASQRQVREAVGTVLFERYDSLLLGASLDAMGDVMRCPRRDCGLPVVIEREERMAVCPSCQVAFCSVCRRTFHGVNPCALDNTQRRALAAEYAAADTDAAAVLEKKYGRRQLQTLLNAVQSEEWIENNSKPCPDCKASIEKSGGCNKVVCGKCNVPFCWLCSARLNPRLPYQHFTDPSSPCAGALFRGMEMPEEFIPWNNMQGNANDEDDSDDGDEYFEYYDYLLGSDDDEDDEGDEYDPDFVVYL